VYQKETKRGKVREAMAKKKRRKNIRLGHITAREVEKIEESINYTEKRAARAYAAGKDADADNLYARSTGKRRLAGELGVSCTCATHPDERLLMVCGCSRTKKGAANRLRILKRSRIAF